MWAGLDLDFVMFCCVGWAGHGFLNVLQCGLGRGVFFLMFYCVDWSGAGFLNYLLCRLGWSWISYGFAVWARPKLDSLMFENEFDK